MLGMTNSNLKRFLSAIFCGKFAWKAGRDFLRLLLTVERNLGFALSFAADALPLGCWFS